MNLILLNLKLSTKILILMMIVALALISFSAHKIYALSNPGTDQPGVRSCKITGYKTNIPASGPQSFEGLTVNYTDGNKTWNSSDDRNHHEIEWYEMSPEGDPRYTEDDNLIKSPDENALGIFDPELVSERGGIDPSHKTDWTPSKSGTTVLRAHMFIRYSGGTCGECSKDATASHAYCDTPVITVGGVSSPTPSGGGGGGGGITVTITGGPSGTVTDTTAVFSFISNKTNAKFKCKLDNQTETTCTSPKQYPNLTTDTHNFTVTATNPNTGNKATANRTWQVGNSSSPPTATPTSGSSQPPGGIILQKIEISENKNFPAGSATTVLNKPFSPDVSQQVYSTIKFANATPGMKTIYVRYTSNQPIEPDINPVVISKDIELVADTDSTGKTTYPKITSVSCSADASNNVTFNITGTNFGSGLTDSDNFSHAGVVKSQVSSQETLLDLKDGTWIQNPTDATPLIGTLNSVPDTNVDFPITVIRFDGRQDPANPSDSPTTCNPTKQAQLSVGTGYYCPAIPNHLERNVDLKVYHVVNKADVNGSPSVAQVSDQTVNIMPNGLIDWLGHAFSFITGQDYFVSIDTPTAITKYSDEFTAPAPGSNGGVTKVINNLKLYQGDIIGDSEGVGNEYIDTFDQSAMFTQWGNYTEGTRTADFNIDGAVNSFDWACMIFGYKVPTPTQPFTVTETDSNPTSTEAPIPTPNETESPSPEPS